MDWVRFTSFSFQLLGLMHLPLASRTIRTIARRYCLLACEFPVLEENPIRSTLTLSAGSPTLSLMEQVSNDGPSLTSQFVAKALLSANTHNTSQAENNWNPNTSQAVGGRNFSPHFPHRPRSPDCGLTPVLPFIDSPELVPGTLLSPSGGSVSASSRPVYVSPRERSK